MFEFQFRKYRTRGLAATVRQNAAIGTVDVAGPDSRRSQPASAGPAAIGKHGAAAEAAGAWRLPATGPSAFQPARACARIRAGAPARLAARKHPQPNAPDRGCPMRKCRISWTAVAPAVQAAVPAKFESPGSHSSARRAWRALVKSAAASRDGIGRFRGGGDDMSGWPARGGRGRCAAHAACRPVRAAARAPAGRGCAGDGTGSGLLLDSAVLPNLRSETASPPAGFLC